MRSNDNLELVFKTCYNDKDLRILSVDRGEDKSENPEAAEDGAKVNQQFQSQIETWTVKIQVILRIPYQGSQT